MTLSFEELLISAAIGAGYWASGGVIFRFAKPMGVFEGRVLPLSYLAVAAAAIPTIAVLHASTGVNIITNQYANQYSENADFRQH